MKINLNNIGITLDSLIEVNLDNLGIPDCFGKMYPPLIDDIIDMDGDSIVTSIKNIHREETVPDVLKKISPDIDVNDFILTKIGADKIENTKKELAMKFTEKISKCINCKFHLPCNNMTNNYLLRLLLDQINNIN